MINIVVTGYSLLTMAVLLFTSIASAQARRTKVIGALLIILPVIYSLGVAFWTLVRIYRGG